MRTKFIKAGVIILALVLSSTIFAAGQWSSFSSKDEMTGEVMWYARSPQVGPVSKMGFPYSDTKAQLMIGFDGESEWVYIYFTNEPNLLNTTIRDGYNLIETRVKWDDDLRNASLIQEWGSKFIHFQDDETVISMIKKSNTLLLELNWFGEGKVHFSFPLAGSSSVINEIRSTLK